MSHTDSLILDLHQWADRIPATDDFTLRWERSEFRELLSQNRGNIDEHLFHQLQLMVRPGQKQATEKPVHQVEFETVFRVEGVEKKGRFLVCSAFRTQFVSATIRAGGFASAISKARVQHTQNTLPVIVDVPGSADQNAVSDKSKEWRLSKPRPEKYLWQTDTICNWFVDVLGKEKGFGLGEARPQGLIVIAGATNTSKSNLAKGLALRFLLSAARDPKYNQRLADGSSLHLVTFEDPIEDWVLFDPDDNEYALRPYGLELSGAKDSDEEERIDENDRDVGIWFTPRQFPQDVSSLAQAKKAALRQTTSCFFVGELRDLADWGTLSELAGTGHLVVVTTHAGSLTEVFGTMFKALGIHTPAAREQAASKLLAVIHLRSHIAQDTEIVGVLPTVWLRKPTALARLVADGMSALTPNGDFVIGRSDAARRLFSLEPNRDAKLIQGVVEQAIDWDLQGI